MKRFIGVCFLMGIVGAFLYEADLYAADKQTPAKITTVRAPAQYLSTDPLDVEDTCPGEDIINRFTCPKEAQPGTTCFDVYRVQGDPVAAERYTLLSEEKTTQNTTAEPACNFTEELTCENFLKALNYNLDFSWFIDNFPSSSFIQCQETYTCTRVACLRKLPNLPDGQAASQKLTCVFKKNQIYFLGNTITCEDKNKAAATPQ